MKFKKASVVFMLLIISVFLILVHIKLDAVSYSSTHISPMLTFRVSTGSHANTLATDVGSSLTFRVCLPREPGTYNLPENFSQKKKGSVVWLRDQCHTEFNRDYIKDQSHTEDYLEELKKHINVHVIDGCRNNTTHTENVAELKHKLTDYRFYMSDGSMFCDNYITQLMYRLLEDEMHVVHVVKSNSNQTKRILYYRC